MKQDVTEAVGWCLESINCDAATKNTLMDNFNGCHHESHPNLNQHISIDNHMYPLHYFLVPLRYENLIDECFQGKQPKKLYASRYNVDATYVTR